MSNYVIQDTSLVNIANAIRSKTGESALLTPAEMVAAINSITTGGGSSGGWILRKEFYETSTVSGVSAEIIHGSYIDIDTELAQDKAFIFLFTSTSKGSSSSASADHVYLLFYDGSKLVSTDGSKTAGSRLAQALIPLTNDYNYSFEVNYDSSTQTNIIRINNNETSASYDVDLYKNAGYTVSGSKYVWGNMFYLDESFNEISEINVPYLDYWDYQGHSNGMIAVLFDKLTFNVNNSVLTNTFSANNAFTNFPTDWRNKTINVQGGDVSSSSLNMASFLRGDRNIKYLPKIVLDANIDTTFLNTIQMNNAFRDCRLIKIDNDAIPQNLIADGMEGSSCSYCMWLREVPENFMANSVYISTIFPGQNMKSMCYEMYAQSFLLKQVIGAPIFGQTWSTGTVNRFTSMFADNNALHRVSFYMPNGAVGTMNATNQTIDLSAGSIGFFPNSPSATTLGYLEDDDRANVIIISAANNNATVANMQNLNSLAVGLEYATYNRQSAVETINSLPDTTAAIAAKGGTNTIKFKSGAGSAYGELYNMSNLSAEEIAVATAKGWTVALV